MNPRHRSALSRLLPATLSGLAGLILIASALRAFAAPSQPNIILVMTDDQGYGDLACHGNAMIRTPHLDQLHASSVRLTQFHVDPTCSPTRAALLTGRYSTRTGVWHTIMGRSLMPAREVTLAECLAQAGYRNGIFGKWHLGDNYPMRPQDQGFHQVLVHGGGGIGQTPDFWGNDYFDDTYWLNGRPQSFEGYCTDVFFEQALAFIDDQRRKKEPFFVYLPTNVPHSPYRVPQSYADHYLAKGVPPTMARFYGMIEHLDANVGRLLQQLRDWNLEQNTLLIFTTDNGTAEGLPWPNDRLPEDAKWQGYNAGMRGKKGSPYEGGHRVPCFLRWPAQNIQGGRDIDALTAHLDLLPTILDLVQADQPANLPLDGRSLKPLLQPNTPAVPWPDRTLIVHSQRIEHPQPWRQSSVMQGPWRLVNGRELYNLTSDPGQAQDIAGGHSGKVAELRAFYEAWWETLQPALDNYAWIGLGAEAEIVSRLTCHDWHSDRVPWHQGHIKEMPDANGYWMVEVAQPGDYLFTLRHQPVEAKFLLQATHARIRLGEQELTHPIEPETAAVSLEMALTPGRYRLQTWLEDPSQDISRGAFFVDVMRLSPP